jgi:hypothetical protein
MALLIARVYHLTLQGWIGHLVPGVLAVSLAWLLAGAVVLLSAVSIAGELAGVRHPEGK